jgi:hypothetical protein
MSEQCPLYPQKQTFRAAGETGVIRSPRPRRTEALTALRCLAPAPSRLQHWQVRGLGTLKDAAGIEADLTIHVHEVGSVTHQPPNGCHISVKCTMVPHFHLERTRGMNFRRTISPNEIILSYRDGVAEGIL